MKAIRCSYFSAGCFTQGKHKDVLFGDAVARKPPRETMDARNPPNQAGSHEWIPFVKQNALVLNQSPAACPANRCVSLLDTLKTYIPFRQVQERNATGSLQKNSFIPDLVILRLSLGSAPQTLIDSCKKMWNRASIMALFCSPSHQALDNSSALFSGVDDFIFCPFRPDEMVLRIRRIFQFKGGLRASPDVQANTDKLRLIPVLSESPSFLQVIEKIPLVANCEATVLISGETGSGKEVIARAIHYQGAREGKPFIPVNCGALPDHLFENELFGHVKGAFTDASSAEKGLIAEADGGTLFLDEVDALSHSGQVKLLRFLQDGEYRAIGSSRSDIANVRVIAATNTDLEKRVKSQLFREDLYYRLNSLSLRVPPLRERGGDLVLLVNFFLNRYATERGQQAREISHVALRKLMAYSWPGNVRELESVLTRALVYSLSETLQPDDIEIPGSDHVECRTQFLREAKSSTIEIFERSYLAKLLAEHQGNITHAAKAAGKERRSFQRLLRKYALDRHSFQV